MDKAFYAHGRLRWRHNANTNAPHCAAFYLLSSCHAIHEEYRHEHIAAVTKDQNADVVATPKLSITDYLIAVASQFKKKYNLDSEEPK